MAVTMKNVAFWVVTFCLLPASAGFLLSLPGIARQREENWQEMKKGLRKYKRLEIFHLSHINRKNTRRRNLL
jgi:hypothetical protein